MKQLFHNRLARRLSVLALITVLLTVGGVFGWRAYRMADLAIDFEAQIRYLVENEGTIGAAPAETTFSDLYLEAIFGDNPELLDQLKVVIRRGLEEDPDLNMGEVAAMIVTHREDDQGNITDVAAHIVGGFPMGRLSPQFHRDGFFRHQVDDNLWTMGNSILRFVGRDMVLFADETVADTQMQIAEGILQGNIVPLVNHLDRPIFYTAVLPNPRRVVPSQLRHHVQAVLYRGAISPYQGRSEMVLLNASPRSANYTMSVVSDLKRVAEIALKTKFKGVVQETEWGPVVNPWWAYEMVQTSEDATVEREENIVRITTEYDRVMVNAVLKTLERFGRDWNQMRLSMEEQMDPREVDALMATQKPLHYWSDEHRWGPNWPIAPSAEELELNEREQEAAAAEEEARRAAIQADRLAIAAERAEARAAQAEAQLTEAGEPTTMQQEMASLTRQQAEQAAERAQEAEREAQVARGKADEAQAAVEEAEQLQEEAQAARLERLR